MTDGINVLYNQMWKDFEQVGKVTVHIPKIVPPLTIHDVKKQGGETWEQRIERMLRPMQKTCISCSMCELGRDFADDSHPKTLMQFDPHVFSNMNPSRWMIYGQNPGTQECIKGEPFVGQSGEFFNKVLAGCDTDRSQFYISNAVKCKTPDNKTPSHLHKERCEPFLRMELQLIRPILVVTLGAVAFDVLCPDLVMSQSLGKIVISKKFDVKVYPIYHPSPVNMKDSERKKKFVEDLYRLCKLIKKYHDSTQ